MIDLEDALSAFVERAPEPPDVTTVARRARQRRWRRRVAALTAAAVVVAAGIAGTVVGLGSSPGTRHVSVAAPPVDSVHVTLVDGSQLDITGPPSLGLTKLPISFTASLVTPYPPETGSGHTFAVERDAPNETGAIVGRYPTHDGHELVAYTTQYGVDAVVHYDDWSLVVAWSHDPTDWAMFASELNAKETADGFLVVEPVDPGWHVGIGDGPDVQLGGNSYDRAATYSFFGPHRYPAGCPTAAATIGQTPQGWGVGNGYVQSHYWCDADAHVRIVAWDPALADAAEQGLRVAYRDPSHNVDRVTTLNGDSYEISAPSWVLDQLALQAGLSVDGLDPAKALPVNAQRATLPSAATGPSYATADGHQLSSYVEPGECACAELVGTYGDWLVKIEVDTMPDAQLTQIASLFAAHETADGFLVLDPVAPMHLTSGGGSPVVLDHFDLDTLVDPPQVIDRDPTGHPAAQIEVRRITP
jgi:hypothetical protein